MSPPTTATTPINLVIRFSTSNPDLVLSISSPSTTSALALKQDIRSHLPSPTNESKLRLIHSGRVLPDNAALSKSLNLTTPPPPSALSAKATGKLPVKELGPRVYIHCSIGDALSADDLAKEKREAEQADAALRSERTSKAVDTEPKQDDALTTTTPAPRGFDRLLTAGFTSSEVAALRAQFLAIQSHTHTPDTMPTGQQLLALEERWLDSGSNTAEDGTNDAGGFGAEDSGGLEDMLYGNLIGFFWPIGAMCWLMREEGVWSRRRQIAVLSGFMVNLLFGGLKWIN
ncbi:uncharacterized protein MYCFIDRAFT_63030 [Pseudocercospora fijiensis CIRAD86]|uniref:Ubiquitin-like domain-containing protein n=1 Tax=Pseudocercospora fijiensis (strain CIRAD86) TaxID=383855 RepID=N1Q9A9_PSEFD|nr:uncharacterized protein MYCFIDRAFT_63030 [Pseudocercospora fijiensis CIRAD86]EME89459.1 hypothetical protein MYCFIDRAFT_63030 [Pseudocercospora fijiensis CIRAD86]